MGEIVEGNRRFTMQVRFPEEQRNSVDTISNLRVGDSKVTLFHWPNSPISRTKKGQRRLAVKTGNAGSVWN